MRVRILLVTAILLGLVMPSWSTALPSAPMSLGDPLQELGAEPPWWTAWSRDRDGDRIDDQIQAIERGDTGTSMSTEVPRFAAYQTPDGWRYNVFVRFQSAPGPIGTAAVAEIVDGPIKGYDWAELVYVPDVDLDAVQRFADLPGVRGVELERVVVPAMTTATQALLVNRSVEFGDGARERWKVDGDKVVIAFLDTGIDQGHEMFDTTRFVGGYDATIPIGSIGAGPVAPGSLPVNARDPDDDSPRTHGTHVASLAVASHQERTWMGVAPRASFLDVKVMRPWPLVCPTEPCGTSSTPYGIGSMVIEGLDFVLRYNDGKSHLGAPDPAPARVVTMSLGEEEPDINGTSVLSHAVNRVVDRGVVVVAAAGNCGPTGSSSCSTRGQDAIAAPGAAKRALTVGAMDHAGTVPWSDDRIAGFSSRGPNGGEPKPNVVAYGVNITGAKGDPSGNATDADTYQQLTGTSMAVPFVAGVAALMIQGNATLDADEVKRLIIQTARQVGPDPWDPAHGAGVVNAYFALGAAVGILDPRNTRIGPDGKDIPPVIIPEPPEAPEPEPRNRTIVNQPPRVSFIFGPSLPKPGDPVVYADRSHDREGDRLVAWNWDFGDGNTAKGDRVVHRYDKAGTYLVRLTVTDSKGAAGSDRLEVTVVDLDVGESPVPAAGLSLMVVFGLLVAGLHWLRPRITNREG